MAALLIEIEDSPIEGIETGKHSFTYINDNGIRYMFHSGTSGADEPIELEGREERARNLVNIWITYANLPLIPYGEQYSEEYYAGVMYMLDREYHADTVEEYRDEAKRVFGIDILNDIYADDVMKIDEIVNLNLYTERHYQNILSPRDVIDSSDSHVVMQFYADYGRTIPAYKVRYDLAFDVDDLVFRGSEKFDDTGKDIRQLYSGENEAEIAE